MLDIFIRFASGRNSRKHMLHPCILVGQRRAVTTRCEARCIACWIKSNTVTFIFLLCLSMTFVEFSEIVFVSRDCTGSLFQQRSSIVVTKKCTINPNSSSGSGGGGRFSCR